MLSRVYECFSIIVTTSDAELLDWLTYHGEIVETGTEPWRFKSRSQS